MCRTRRQGRIATAIAATLFLASAQLGAVQAHAAAAVDFYIESQPLVKALNEWAIQAGLQVVWPAGDTEAYSNSTPVRGALAPMDALSMLLEGTGLTFSVVSDGRIVAIRDREQTARVRGISNERGMSASVSSPGFLRIAAGGEESVRSASSSDVRRDGGSRRDTETERVTTEELQEIVVTGTHIRGAAPVGSPVIVTTREDIETAGVASVGDYLRKLPQNFSDADSAGFVGAVGSSSAASNNSGRGSSINLRGLGADATLVLLNGQRVAPGGQTGEFVDVSMIPVTALDRIEMLTDGASAVYGSDAIAGAVNFILRRDVDGAETAVRYGASEGGDAEQRTVSQLVGHTWTDGNVLGVYEYSEQGALRSTDRDFVPEQLSPVDLLPEQERHSVILAGNSTIGGATISADAFYSHRDFSQQYADLINVFDVKERGTSNGYGGTVRLKQDLPSDWQVEAVGSYSAGKEERASQFAGGAEQELENESNVFSGSLRGNGPLFDVPAGDLRASLGGDFRQERFENVFIARQRLQRDIYGVYGELLLPLLGAENKVYGAKRLDLSAALRYDHYSDVGSSTNPKFGITWSPVEGLDIRSSYSTSFRAPLLAQLTTEGQTYFAVDFPDPGAADGTTVTLVNSSGSNPNLQPETASSFTIGFDFKKGGLRLSPTYFNIDFKKRIAFPPIAGGIFDIYLQQQTLGSFFNLNPAVSDIEDIFASQTVFDLTGLGPAGVEATFDTSPQNIARSRASGVDLIISNGFESEDAHVDLFFNANYLLQLESQPARTAASIDLVDTVYNPPSLRIRGGATWSNQTISATAVLNYQNSYDNNLATVNAEVDAWLTADVQVNYDWRNTRFSFAVQNVTDEDPPTVIIQRSGLLNLGYDATNASPLGRTLALSIRQSW